MSKFAVAGLNLVTHPHSPLQYVEMLEKAFTLERVIKIGQHTSITLGSLTRISEDDPLAGLNGVIFRFTEIDLDQAWLNTLTGKVADPKDLEQIKLPKNLKPHFKMFRFHFFPQEHLIVFAQSLSSTLTPDGKPTTLAPDRAKEFFFRLLNDNELRQTYPIADLTVVQSAVELEKLWKLPFIKHVCLEIKLPNTGGETEREVTKRLEDMNAGVLTEEIIAKKGDGGLIPTPSLQNYCNVALKNGFVVAEGRDHEDNVIKVNTDLLPLIVGASKPKKQTFYDAFEDAVLRFLKKVP